MPIAQSASEKVDVMLNTFFNEKPIKVLTTQTNPEKVTYGGNLFEKWPEMGLNRWFLMLGKAKITQTKPEKVTCTVGTFLGKGQKWVSTGSFSVC
jgi:hypothetical protein